MSEYGEPVSEQEKVRIVSEFIRHAPPGEFNEVFNDIRVLLDNDGLLRDSGSIAFRQHNMEQFTPCTLEGVDDPVLITKHGLLADGDFYDPKSKMKFKYDHLRKEGTVVSEHEVDGVAEPWRSAVDDAFREYMKEHYPTGACSVYGKSSGDTVTVVICLERHQFQPQNFWNGRWRSEWIISFNPDSPGSAELKGLLRLQVHYYEDGNVQLVSHKEVTTEVKVSDPQSTAKEVKSHIGTAEEDYQRAIGENYTTMSDTTFKALRRQLPITRTKIDWNKLLTYRIGAELAKS